MTSHKSRVQFGLLLLLFFLILSVPAFFLGKFVQAENIRAAIISFGWLSPLFFILIASVSNILPSVAAMPFWLVGVSVFGSPAYIYILVSNTFGSLINYLLARKFGRLFILKLAGQQGLEEIDKLTGLITPRTIFLLRLVGGSLTDYISYAAGLMGIDVWIYLQATVLGGLPMLLLAFYFIHEATSSGLLGAAGNLGVFYLINYLSSLLIIPLVLKSLKKN